jgi:hypothetical protein
MSQKGLIALAAQGLSPTQILGHYFQFIPPFVQSVEISVLTPMLAGQFVTPPAGMSRRQLFFNNLSNAQAGGAFPEPASQILRSAWRRGLVDPATPASTTRYLDRQDRGCAPFDQPLGVAVFFNEKMSGTKLPNSDSAVTGMVKFYVIDTGTTLTLAQLGGVVHIFSEATEMETEGHGGGRPAPSRPRKADSRTNDSGFEMRTTLDYGSRRRRTPIHGMPG